MESNKTFCFFCGIESTGLEKECDKPVCIERYRMVKEDKRHPFHVSEYEALQNIKLREGKDGK